jgi:hypothetical protein
MADEHSCQPQHSLNYAGDVIWAPWINNAVPYTSPHIASYMTLHAQMYADAAHGTPDLPTTKFAHQACDVALMHPWQLPDGGAALSVPQNNCATPIPCRQHHHTDTLAPCCSM